MTTRTEQSMLDPGHVPHTVSAGGFVEKIEPQFGERSCTEATLPLWGAVKVVAHGRSVCGQGVDHKLIRSGEMNPAAFAELDALAQEHLIGRVLHPRPVFSGQIVAVPLFRKEYERPGYSLFVRDGENGIGDGALLEPGDAYYLASGDCHTIIARNGRTGDVVAAHAGRENLYDKALVAGMDPSRKHKTIVDAIFETLRWQAQCNGEMFLPRDISVHIACGIAPASFDHKDPAYAQFNQKMYAYLSDLYGEDVFLGDPTDCKIDMPKLIERQFEEREVQSLTHDGIDTYSDTDFQGRPLWWSNKRQNKERNLVLVVRKW